MQYADVFDHLPSWIASRFCVDIRAQWKILIVSFYTITIPVSLHTVSRLLTFSFHTVEGPYLTYLSNPYKLGFATLAVYLSTVNSRCEPQHLKTNCNHTVRWKRCTQLSGDQSN